MTDKVLFDYRYVKYIHSDLANVVYFFKYPLRWNFFLHSRGGGNRTHKSFQTEDFKSSAFAISPRPQLIIFSLLYQVDKENSQLFLQL